ncbi:hypothetical protein [Paenibacillus sp. GP183]|uniref:hypothetical protein n=1 Tax=Paenibacillus sp. GP183 TaxID=1882751 RepID=UPI0008971593|nr:hypothetical protein [Paenibacillus sp. GP183]SEB57213.1 hypothetical protein SAMN05443246_1130 [Paenibacillus sp. GP183]
MNKIKKVVCGVSLVTVMSLASISSAFAADINPMTQANASLGSGGQASNARSGPASGGASGTIDSVSTSGFTMTTSAGVKVTVNVASSTTYKKSHKTRTGEGSERKAPKHGHKTSSTSTNAVKTGERVLVLGTTSASLSPTTSGSSKSTSGTTITATQVIVQPNGGGRSTTSSGASVIPFQPGQPTTSKQVGQIPANYVEGSGTIVSGTAANKATEAALAAYPGGVVDRVVQLTNGEYEVHNVGVNWPHHIFVSKDFKVVGAN